MKKETLNLIKTLEERINTVMDKVQIIKRKNRLKKRDLKQRNLKSTRKKKFELSIIEIEKNL